MLLQTTVSYKVGCSKWGWPMHPERMAGHTGSEKFLFYPYPSAMDKTFQDSHCTACMWHVSTDLRRVCGDSFKYEQWAVMLVVTREQPGPGQGPGSDHLTTAWCCHVVMLSAASTSLSCNLSSRLHNGNWSANLLILNSNWRSIVREPIIWRRYHFSITHYPHN